MSEYKFFLTVAIMALITAGLRYAPFIIFGTVNKTPYWITKLGEMLPFAVIAMLIVYCFKDVTPLSYPYGLPEIISVVLVAVLHIWKRNTLLSMLCGTACYMILIQAVFV